MTYFATSWKAALLTQKTIQYLGSNKADDLDSSQRDIFP